MPFVIVVCSDTHSDRGHELEGAVREAVSSASMVIHAGDFTSEAALEDFQDVTNRLVAVHGNADEPAVCERLPTRTVTEHGEVRVAVIHRPEGGEAGLAAFGRSEEADVVVFGHTHRPTLVETGGPVLLNPGSHAQPRGNRPGFAAIETGGEGLSVTIREPDGTLIENYERSRGR